jgi:hypothetical protein
VQGGTCSIAKSNPPEQVIHRALYLLQYGFGSYHVFLNNCEDFAVIAKLVFGQRTERKKLEVKPLPSLVSHGLPFFLLLSRKNGRFRRRRRRNPAQTSPMLPLSLTGGGREPKPRCRSLSLSPFLLTQTSKEKKFLSHRNLHDAKLDS